MSVNAPHGALQAHNELLQTPGAKLVLDRDGVVQMVLPRAPGLKRLQAWLSNNYDPDALARLGAQDAERRMKTKFEMTKVNGVRQYQLKPGSAPGVLARHRNRLANEGVADAVLRYITFKDFSTVVAAKAKANWKERVVTLPKALFAYEVARLLRSLNNAEHVARNDHSARMLIRSQLTACVNGGQLLHKEPLGRIEELAVRLHSKARLERDAQQMKAMDASRNAMDAIRELTLDDVRPHVLAAIAHFRQHADVTRLGETYPAVDFQRAPAPQGDHKLS